MRILVTGHVGFIGSHFVKHVLSVDDKAQIIGFSRCSDQGNLARLPFFHSERLTTVYGDLTDPQSVSGICEGIDVVVNFAAKTFVDHSLKDAGPFIQSNIIGADNLMTDATRYGVKRFVQVSTDEVYGQILTGAYKEDALLNPRNPYAWSKACADLDAIQRHRTYGFPVIITRTENNFGPWQHRQKVLPTFVRTALAGEPLPVYGDGLHVRCWLHVEEHCRAIWHLIQMPTEMPKGNKNWSEDNIPWMSPDNLFGQVFHVAGEQELTNIDLAKLVLKTLGKPETQIRYVPDHNIRPGHDRRYALDCSKLRATGFEIKQNLEERLAEVILWYAKNPEWTR
jgi:dTDP-glucose 4,6-dehydratase